MNRLPGSAPKLPSLHLAKVQALVFRLPIDEPVQTSFGIMHDRPAVLVRVDVAISDVAK